MELDLLLGGRRLPMSMPLPAADYYYLVSRAEQRPDCQVFSWNLAQPLLALPVPLKSDRAIDVCQRRGISLNVNAVREDEGPTSAQTNIFAAVADVAALKYDRHMARQIDVGQAESQTSAGGAHQICRKTLKHRPSERQKRTDLRATAKD